MAGASRRGYGEDGIYFDHRGERRDSTLHKTCSGRWRGVVSLGFDADGKDLTVQDVRVALKKMAANFLDSRSTRPGLAVSGDTPTKVHVLKPHLR